MPLALVTGASTGIGRATALHLAARGWTVLAGVREAAAGERLSADAPPGSRLVVIALDVTDAGDVERAVETVAAHFEHASSPGGLDALVNNAGIGVGGPLELISDADLRRQFDVNVFAQVAMTRAMLAALRRARGRVVFVSSIGGRVALAYSAPYAASKHAIEAIGDALRVELHGGGVHVVLIEPGSVATPIWDKSTEQTAAVEVPAELAGVYGHVPAAMAKAIAQTASRGVPPQRVAETIERALTARRPRDRYLVGIDARAMLLAKRLLPARVFDAVVRRQLGV